MEKAKDFFKRNILWMAGICAAGLLPFWEFLLSNRLLYGSDSIGSPGIKPFLESIKNGVYPLWHDYQVGGMPTIDALIGDPSYPPYILLGMILSPERLLGYCFIFHVLIAGAGAFILARKFFNLDKWWCFILSTAYMLNTNYITLIYGGHTGKFYVLSWLPLSLYFLFTSLGKQARWYHVVGLSLSVSTFLLTSHIQLTYFVLMGFFMYWCHRMYGPLRKKDFARAGGVTVKFWVPILLGIGISFMVFYPPLKYNKEHSIRGTESKQTYEHATSWSLNPEEIGSLVVPEFAGILDKYWGRNFFKLNAEYSGTFILVLALFGLFVIRSGPLKFWAFVGVMSIIFTLGDNTPFFHLFYKVVPGIKNFRAPSMMIFWYVMSLWIMSAYTLSWIMEQRDKFPNADRAIKAGLGICAVIGVSGILSSTTYSIWNVIFSADASKNFTKLSANYSDYTLGAIKAAVFFGVLMLCIKYMLKNKYDLKKIALIMFAVTYADLFWMNSSFIKTYNFSDYFPSDPVIEHIAKDTSKFRVIGLPRPYWPKEIQGMPELTNKGFMAYKGIQPADGFVDHQIAIYNDFRGGDYQVNPNFMHGLKQNSDGTVSGSNFLDILNVKYMMFWQPNRTRGVTLNKSMLPRAYIAADWEIDDDNRILEGLKGTDLDLRNKVLVSSIHRDIPASTVDSATPSPIIHEISRNANEIVYDVKLSSNGIFVLSEVYFPFWRVQVDGRDSELLRVNYIVRGAYIPKGEHKVRFYYNSPNIKLGLKVGFLSVLLLAGFAVGMHFFSKRKLA